MLFFFSVYVAAEQPVLTESFTSAVSRAGAGLSERWACLALTSQPDEARQGN